MPRVYTDSNSNWLSEYSLGQQGIVTGSVYNTMGLSERQQHATHVTPTGTRHHSGTEATEPSYPWVDDLFARIPAWFHWALACILAFAAVTYAWNVGWREWQLAWAAAIGAFSWPFLVGTLIVTVKFILFSLTLAIIGAIGYGIYWALTLYS